MKACPVVLRLAESLQILAFEHPLAGLQLVKGTVEPGEESADAAVRELFEESGVAATRLLADLGAWASGHQQQTWSFHLCEVPTGLPDAWVHRTADDGGHDFRFFWYPLHETPDGRWHPVFQRALAYLAAQALALHAMLSV